MTDIVTCPDQATLDRLLAGLVADDQAVELEQHLLGCQRCCQTVRELPAGSKESIASARAASELSEERAVIEVAQRVASLRLPDYGAAPTETVVVGAETTADAWDVGRILDPPTSEGVIGRFGGYRVLRLLGAGGMGLVWEAEDPQLCRRVALKVMKPALAEHRQHRERFLREARAAAAIDHSHIVTVYQVGEHRGLPFLAMQLLRGETLDETLRREGRLPQVECLRIGRQVAEALGVAHRRGLIHRDVKPANIWLETDGGWVKLVDFGLAQALADDSHLTQTGVILGTPAFMSPEQARGDAVDPRSDLFSLGAVLYRMATGVGPFAGPSTLAVLTSLALRVPEPPHQINPDILPDFSDLIMRLLAKEPADRPASAEEVVQAIRNIEASPSRNPTPPRGQSTVAPTLRGGDLDVATGDRRSSPSSRRAGTVSTLRRRRWLTGLVAAAGAAALLLAGIVIIIRDKQGNKIGEISYRDGHSAEIFHTDPASEAADKKTPADPGLVNKAVTAPAAVADPPPLDDWLRGRDVLTVSLDGRGKFKTIQAAIDAMKPGQAVEVLDRGPYRETLLMLDLKNAGLISRAGTVIEPAGKRRACFEGDTADFHFFTGADRFRLSGLSFVADDLGDVGQFTAWISFAMSGEVLVERCRFAGGRPWMREVSVWWDGRGPGAICHIRECLFETALNITTFERGSRPVAIIERNWFRTTPQDTSLMIDGPAERVVIRHNVFDGRQQNALTLWKTDDIGRLEIYNNTMKARLLAREKLSKVDVQVRNNLFREGMIMDDEGDQAVVEAAVKGWRVGNNEYAEAPRGADQFPKTASDFVGEPKFLSADSTDTNYLRIPSDDEEALRGRGGEWPDYLGALPPGPAPKEGDWLTRWIEGIKTTRALNPAPEIGDVSPGGSPSATTSPPAAVGATLAPAKIPEPPALDEWLKGCKILTVSQDGRGQFKTIQAALDAVQPGQAVEVLDRGPYRELLACRDKSDFGLISRAGAVIESGGTRNPAWDKDPADFHNFTNIGRFRLSGISFVAHADDLSHMRAGAPWFVLGAAGDVVIENCHFAGGRPGHPEVNVYYPRALPGAVLTVRECLLDAAINITWAVGEMRPLAVIERNWFRAVPQREALQIQGPGQAVVVRHNVFDVHDRIAINLFETGGTSRTEIYNNTLLAPVEFTADPARSHLFMPTNVVIRNNLFPEGIGCHAGPKASLAAAKGWQVGNNEYGEAPERADQFPKTEADFVGGPRFLSRQAGEPDYMRIAADSQEAHRGAGGAWPSYLGALPPGPAPADGDWLRRWIAAPK